MDTGRVAELEKPETSSPVSQPGFEPPRTNTHISKTTNGHLPRMWDVIGGRAPDVSLAQPPCSTDEEWKPE